MTQGCHPSGADSKRPSFWPELLSLFLAVVAMIFGMPQILGFNLGPQASYVSAAAAMIVVFVFGWRFLLGIPELFYRPNMNTLVGLGVSAAFGFSAWQLLQGNTDQLFFESAAFVVAFVRLGHWVENLLKHRIYERLPQLSGFLPQEVTSFEGQVIKTDELKAGDKIRLSEGKRVPADSVLLSEEGHFDQSAITGESQSITHRQGDTLLQGVLNSESPVEIEIKADVENSFYHQALKSMERTLSEKPAFQKSVDRWAAIFVPIVLLLSLAAGIYWWQVAGDQAFAIKSLVSVLVIACPCALGLATPLAYVVATYRASRLGTILQSLEVVERSQEITHIAFDKTGTLTKGVPELMQTITVENVSNKEALSIAASLEKDFEHPYAKALLQAAEKEGAQLASVQGRKSEAGKGIVGSIEKNGKTHEYCIGNLVWLYENGVEASELDEKLRWHAEGAKATALWLAMDKKTYAIFILNDPLRDDAEDVMAELRAKDYKIGLITGDAQSIAEQMAKRLQLNFYHYSVLPSEKATIVRRLSEKQKKGIDFFYPKVAFVGDGINDGPALAEAHLSIAMGSGTPLAQNYADFILTKNELKRIPEIFGFLKSTRQLIFQNLSLAFLYNILAIPIAGGVLYPSIGVFLEPEVAAIAMSLSSLSVVANTLRAIRS